MRTGVIFARGSCRTLKWMALFTAVLALGAGSAAAQQDNTAPTISSATFEPGGTSVKLMMDDRVFGSPNNADFTLAPATLGTVNWGHHGDLAGRGQRYDHAHGE